MTAGLPSNAERCQQSLVEDAAPVVQGLHLCQVVLILSAVYGQSCIWRHLPQPLPLQLCRGGRGPPIPPEPDANAKETQILVHGVT